ncbi:60S ribosomal protein L34B [Lodderomyces elongisporus]|uniref:60S ribosomal protein L34B n=1 Tax=Lodderomyces elongisporus TaxID=36914 RepID=UPI002924554A|nr:60S ribosomal protein L34B [Lodderomyces elongisporus]WLF77065.1 60S ribosomal protein L34B [Lodderomyces elongisporus]
MAQRVTYRRRNPYNTRSNKIKVVKTPGGKLVAQHVKKAASRVKCGDCGSALAGISTLRPREFAQVSKTHKTVQRAYGGSRCANCVKERIVRAFLIEEQKIVKRVLKEQEDKEKKASAKKTGKK